jgi:PqqA peptide cyclase
MNPIALIKALITKKGPVYAHYGITHRCNLKCRMCSLWGTGDKSLELDLTGIKKMAAAFRDMGVQVVSIGGGEPLLRQDLPQAVAAFSKMGISVRVLSNGVGVDRKRLQDVIDAGCVNFSVSLDSLDAEQQDSIAGQAGAFAQVMEMLDFLSPILKRRGGLGILNTVVSGANFESLGEIVDFAESIGFYVSLIPLESKHFGNSCGSSGLQPSQEQKEKGEEIFGKIVEMKKKGKPVFNSTVFLSALGDNAAGERPPWRCLAGELYFSVDPAGNFSICHNFQGFADGKNYPISKKGFLNDYRNALKEKAFVALRSECRECMRPCWAEVSNVFTAPQAFLEMGGIHLSRTIGKFFANERKVTPDGK